MRPINRVSLIERGLTSIDGRFFGPLGLFTHGAASFVYELFPSGNDGYTPNLQNTATLSVLSFSPHLSPPLPPFPYLPSSFGAQQSSTGSWTYVPERIPVNWTNRISPYTPPDVSNQIFLMYSAHPVGLGGNAGGHFVGIDFPPYVNDGNVTAASPADYACLLYQLVAGPVPSSLNGFVTPSVAEIEAAVEAIGGESFSNLGCPIPLT